MWLRGMGEDPAATTPSGTSGDNADWFSALITGLPTLATTVMGAMNQQNLMDYNLELIKAGRPPLTPDQLISLQSGFTPGVNLGVAQPTLNTMTNIAIGGAVLIGGIFLVSQMSGGANRRPAHARR